MNSSQQLILPFFNYAFALLNALLLYSSLVLTSLHVLPHLKLINKRCRLKSLFSLSKRYCSLSFLALSALVPFGKKWHHLFSFFLLTYYCESLVKGNGEKKKLWGVVKHSGYIDGAFSNLYNVNI